MRTVFLFGRICARNFQRQACHRWTSFARPERQSSNASKWLQFRPPARRGPRGIKPIFALLTPAAFVQLSEEDTGDGKTPEEHMLEASRAEIEKTIPEDVHGLKKVWHSMYYVVDTFIWEPLATGFRFLHLVIIFVPVIFAVPMVWFGRRRKEKGNERTGTLWWYRFLVHSMERAGPAFIKVPPPRTKHQWVLLAHFFVAWPMGGVTFRHLPSRNVQHNVLTPLQRSRTLPPRDKAHY